MCLLGLSFGGDFAVEVAPLDFGDQHKSEQVELFIVTLILAQSILVTLLNFVFICRNGLM